MIIAISSEGPELSSALDTRFGRAGGFLLYDTESGSHRYIDNKQNLDSQQGAGIQSAKTVIDAGAEVLITGNVGPKAFTTLNSAGIKIYLYKEGDAGEAVRQYRNGSLQMISEANVEGHW